MTSTPGTPKSLADAEINRIHVVNKSTVLVELSTGDGVLVETEKLKELALQTGKIVPPELEDKLEAEREDS